MPAISIHQESIGEPFVFTVTVRDAGGETKHQVTLARGYCDWLTKGGATPAQCVEAAFRFLIDREPKESILRRFDVSVIAQYFPEFERELTRYLGRSG